MADIFTADFEGGTPFANWDTAAASVTQNTSIFHGGAASALHTATGSPAPLLTESIAGSPTVLVAQWWFYVPASMPNGYTGITIGRVLCSFFNIFFKLNHTTTFELQMQMSNGTTTTQQTASYVEDSWTRVTMRVNVGVDPMTVDWNVGTAEQTQVTFGGGTTTVTGFNLGTSTLASGLTFYSDDLRLSTTSADYDTYKGAAASAPSTFALLGIS